MRPPYRPNPKSITTEDLDPLYDFIQSLNFVGDGINVVVDHDPTGVNIKFIGDLATPVEESAGGGNLFPAKITSTTPANGLYVVDIYEDGLSEPPSHLGVNALPTIHTFTPLPIGDACVVLLDSVETLGDNEV